jgi:hypothetical protein
LACAAVNDPRGGIDFTAGLQQHEVSFRIRPQVKKRVSHGINVTDPSSQIEDHVDGAHDLAHSGAIPLVKNFNPHRAEKPVQVSRVPSAGRVKRIHHSDFCPGASGQPVHEVAADKTQPTGHQYGLAAVLRETPVHPDSFNINVVLDTWFFYGMSPMF